MFLATNRLGFEWRTVAIAPFCETSFTYRCCRCEKAAPLSARYEGVFGGGKYV